MTNMISDGQIMKADQIGRVRNPRSRQEELLNEFERSGSRVSFHAAALFRFKLATSPLHCPTPLPGAKSLIISGRSGQSPPCLENATPKLAAGLCSFLTRTNRLPRDGEVTWKSDMHPRERWVQWLKARLSFAPAAW